MDLISCYNCGVVLDKSKLIFPDISDDEGRELIEGNFIWNGEEYIAILPCPICATDIREDGN